MSAPPKVGIDGRGRLVAANVFPWHEAIRDLPGARFAKASRYWAMPPSPEVAARLLTILSESGAAISPRVLALVEEHVSRETRRAAAADESLPLPRLPWGDWLKTSPWDHQKRGIGFIRESSTAAIGAGMGTGKSLMVVGGANARGIRKLLVVGPAKAAGVWPREFRLHSSCEWHVENGNRRGRTGAIKRLSLEARWEAAIHTLTRCGCGKPHAVFVNYEAMVREPLSTADMLGLGIEMVVYDECLPTGTMIDTPSGPRPIESLRIGDPVMGVDHRTGEIVVTSVRYTFTSETSKPLHEISGVSMTPNHPVWTDRGYVRADDLRPEDLVCRVRRGADNGRTRHYLRMVHQDEAQTDQDGVPYPEVLRPLVLGALAHVSSRVRSQVEHRTQDRILSRDDANTAGAPRRCSEAGCASARRIESLSEFSGARALSSDESGAGLATSQWWKWQGGYAGTNPAIATAGLANGGSRAHGAAGASADALQAGRGIDSGHGGDRVRRPVSPNPANPGAGCAQGRILDLVRLDSAAILQRTDIDRDGGGTGRRQVFNIETGTGNYVAGGLLVHNCHRLKSAGGGASLTAYSWINQIPIRVGLSGTLIPQTPDDVYGTYRALDPGIFGTNQTSFRAQWIVMVTNKEGQSFPKDVRREVKREFSRKFHSILYLPRVDLKLPPMIHNVRGVELEPAARKVYDSVRDDGIAEITEAVIAAGGNPHPTDDQMTVAPSNAGVELLRLAQITGGATRKDKMPGEPASRDDVVVVSRAKAKALAELLDEVGCRRGGVDGKHPPEPVVVFCRFRHDLDAVREVVAAAKLRYAEVSGARKDGLDDDSKMNPDCDVVGVQIASGGEAVDFTRSHIVVWYSIGWELWRFQQAQKRVHRPGQTRPTLNYYLVCDNTIDGIIYAALAKRENVIDSVVTAYLRNGAVDAEVDTEYLPAMPNESGELINAPVGVPDWLLPPDSPTRPRVDKEREEVNRQLTLSGFEGLLDG